MAIVKIRDGEAFEQAFRRFKKSCEKAGILSDLKKREHFEKPSVQKKKKSAAARKRAMKKVRVGRPPSSMSGPGAGTGERSGSGSGERY